ncbi:TDT malic acid transporter [Schizosaccharomyces japonicus yFS275]|uniref:TDT malic acid transporter n=1 Tax=Schizosaccharomyces japonicus (strain yFS275 / FY16936) TaxID=402676 RepID=B6K1M9_SCHJY|nr:TDT malic acid transporter [Schizosaccharomyces japonicus yFS275]EEB07060.1 TDT malic acid transporter [Schizosaccharomyces japonicus yFS275]
MVPPLLKQRYHELFDLRVRGPRIPLKKRLECFSWAWFASSMGTGGIAMVISLYPYRFYGMNTIGKVVFIFQLCLLATYFICITYRFVRVPGSLQKSWTNPAEMLFIPTSLLSVATSISCLDPFAWPYVGIWMVYFIRVVYWIFVGVSFIFVMGQFYTLYSRNIFTPETIAPALVLPIFPCMICGVIASAIAESQPAKQAKDMVIAGIAFQGLGFWVYIMVYAVNMYKLFIYGLMPASDRPGLFIFVSPPSFTGLTLLDLSFAARKKRPYIFVGENSSEMLEFVSCFMALFMVGLSLFNFSIAFVCMVAGFCSKQAVKFKVSWFAMVFANVGLVMDIDEIGRSVNSAAIKMVGEIAGVAITVVWIALFLMAARAVYVQEILYPGKDENSSTLSHEVLQYYSALQETVATYNIPAPQPGGDPSTAAYNADMAPIDEKKDGDMSSAYRRNFYPAVHGNPTPEEII